MFQNKLAAEKWNELNDAIDASPVRIPCQDSDPDAWFPEEDNGRAISYVLPRKLCASCPVKQLCLEFALINDEQHGLWGGLAPGERKQLRRRAKGR